MEYTLDVHRRRGLRTKSEHTVGSRNAIPTVCEILE